MAIGFLSALLLVPVAQELLVDHTKRHYMFFKQETYKKSCIWQTLLNPSFINLFVAFNTILPSTDAEAEYLLHVEAKALNITEKPCSLKARLRLKERKLYLHLATCKV